MQKTKKKLPEEAPPLEETGEADDDDGGGEGGGAAADETDDGGGGGLGLALDDPWRRSSGLAKAGAAKVRRRIVAGWSLISRLTIEDD
jgi:hypothetical protein